MFHRIKKFFGKIFGKKEKTFVDTPVLSVDIDNTLVMKNKKINLVDKFDREALEKFIDAGGVVCINSNCPHKTCVKIAKSAGIKSGYISSNNGSLVTKFGKMFGTKNHISIKKTALDRETINSVIMALRENVPDAVVALSTDNKKYYVSKRGIETTIMKISQLAKIRNGYSFSNDEKLFEDMKGSARMLQIIPMPKFAILKKEGKKAYKEAQKNIMKEVVKTLEGVKNSEKADLIPFGYSINTAGVQIFNPEASKSKAIEIVVDDLAEQNRKVKPNRVFAVGDGYGDLESVSALKDNPLKQFYLMETAKDDVKLKANKIASQIAKNSGEKESQFKIVKSVEDTINDIRSKSELNEMEK